MKAQILVSRNLRRLRVARGLSQEALAVDAGIDRTYVSRLERELENPTVGVLEKLAVALDAKIVELLDENLVPKSHIAPLPSGRKPKAKKRAR